MKKTTTLLLMTTLFISRRSLAQQPTQPPVPSPAASGTIAGSVIDAASGKAIPFASVTLLKQADSSLVNGAQTDENGSFRLEQVPYGTFELRFSYLGYRTLLLKNIHVREERSSFNLNEIRLKADTKMLREVVIYSEKPLIEQRGSTLIYNVSQSIMNTGAVATDVLRNVPMVTVDIDGNVQIMGKSPVILVNGEETGLGGEQINDILQSISGDAIDRIEVMTNPPAKYKSNGGGVINIILKEGYKIGLNGHVSVSGSTRGIFSNNIYLGYRDEKMVLSVNNTAHLSNNISNGYTLQENLLPGHHSFLNTYNNSHNRSLSDFLNLSFSYDFDKKNSLSLSSRSYLSSGRSDMDYAYHRFDGDKVSTDTSLRTTNTHRKGRDGNIGLRYNRKFNRQGEALTLAFRYSPGDERDNGDYLQQYFSPYPGGLPPRADSSSREHRYNTQGDYMFNADFDFPLRDSVSSFSAGYRGDWNGNDSRYTVEGADPLTHLYERNERLSNDYRYHQYVNGYYLTFSGSIHKKLQYNIGLRWEQTSVGFDFATDSLDALNRYGNLLPSVSISHKIKKLNLDLSYRRDVDRPGTWQLNPFVNYSDIYSISYGNPYLKPNVNDNLSLSLSHFGGKYNFRLGANYSWNGNITASIRVPLSGGVLAQTYRNIASSTGMSAYGYVSLSPFKKLHMNVSASLRHTNYHTTESKESAYFQDGNNFYCFLNANYALTKKFRIEGQMYTYQGSSPQGRSTGRVDFGFAGELSVLDDKGSLNLRIANPFTENKTTFHYSGQYFNTTGYRYYKAQNFTLTFKYRFVRAGKNTFRHQKQDSNENNMIFFY